MKETSLIPAEQIKIKKDFAFVVERYLEVLGDLPEAGLIRAVSAGQKPQQIEVRACQALGLYFSLLNLVEENASAQIRRSLETAGQPSAEGMFRSVMRELKEAKVPMEKIVEALSQTSVEPVLTAHPTEAKRTSILEQHRALYLCLVRLENNMWTPDERTLIESEVCAIIEKIWKTGEIYHEKPQVQDEQNNVLHYLEKVFPLVLPEVYVRLRQAWKWAGMAGAMPDKLENLPRIRFGSWVGGDRDGHPLVQIKNTHYAFQKFRQGALKMLHERVAHLSSSFCMNEDFAKATRELHERLAQMEVELPRQGKPGEVWRHFLNQITVRLSGDVHSYKRPEDLMKDLGILRRSLLEAGGLRIVETELDPVMQLVRSFPFTLARLDFRQNSSYQEKSFLQILSSSDTELSQAFSQMGAADQQKFLEKELDSPRPFTRPSHPTADEAKATLELYRTLRQEIEVHGGSTIGVLITSMTRSASDLYIVHLLLREADIWRNESSGDWNPLHVVPLFETIDDLERAPNILRTYLSNPFVRLSLQRQAQDQGLAVPQQQVMVGYSDSNKDGGVVASFVALHQSQRAMLKVGKELGIKLSFFHGRGGTISRGAGPTQRFLAALPYGALHGGIRLTEQGETISKKYANRITAVYHLESLMAGTINSFFKCEDCYPPEQEALLNVLFAQGLSVYRDLVTDKFFPQFFRDVSPIDLLEHSRIGSRPARRTGVAGIGDLRAIPWNFSWSQNRVLLSGWYGFGSAFAKVRKDNPDLWKWLLQKGKNEALLRYFVGNVATVMAATDLEIAELYIGLSTQPAEHQGIFAKIKAEYALTKEILQEISGQSIQDFRPQTVEALRRREHGLRILHQSQVEMLRQWRSEGAQAQSPLVQELLLNINALAAGLGHTG